LYKSRETELVQPEPQFSWKWWLDGLTTLAVLQPGTFARFAPLFFGDLPGVFQIHNPND
jgi:hypothetical protein